MRFTIWLLSAEIFDVKFEKTEPPKKAVPEKLGGSDGGSFSLGFGYDSREVQVNDKRSAT